MTVPCKVVTVSAPPANITAVSITVSPLTCIAPCNVTVAVVWRNDGGISGTFTPAITVAGVRTAQAAVNLGPGKSITQTFTVPGLAAGSHTICPDPN